MNSLPFPCLFCLLFYDLYWVGTQKTHTRTRGTGLWFVLLLLLLLLLSRYLRSPRFFLTFILWVLRVCVVVVDWSVGG